MRQFARLLACLKQAGEKRVELDKPIEHHGADLGIEHRFRVAVITVKQPRGPSSPDRYMSSAMRIDPLQHSRSGSSCAKHLAHRCARAVAIALIALDVELALVAERAVEARPVHAGGGARDRRARSRQSLLPEHVERARQRHLGLIGARPAAALRLRLARRLGSWLRPGSRRGGGFLFCTISQNNP